MRRISWLGVAIVLAGLIGLGGCNTETKIDKAKAEKLLNDSLDPKAQTLVCPDGITAKAGVTFECQVSYSDGDRGTITVHILDDKGNIHTGPEDLHIQK